MRILLMLIMLSLAACTNGNGNCPNLPGVGTYCIVEGSWPDFETEEAATITYAGKPTQLITRTASGKDGVRFAGITPLGQTLVNVSLESGIIRASLPPGLEGRIDGALFIALLQIAVWPAEDVMRGLQKDLVLADSPGKRVIRRGDSDLLTITWEGNTLPYQRMRFEAPEARLTIDAATVAGAEAQ